jgi:hypothetical protein
MPTFNKYELPDGQSVLIEATDSAAVGGMAVAIGDNIRETGRALMDALDPLSSILLDLKNSAFNALSSPAEVTVEFGVKLTGEVGVIVSKSTGEANFKVTVTWKVKET